MARHLPPSPYPCIPAFVSEKRKRHTHTKIKSGKKLTTRSSLSSLPYSFLVYYYYFIGTSMSNMLICTHAEKKESTMVPKLIRCKRREIIRIRLNRLKERTNSNNKKNNNLKQTKTINALLYKAYIKDRTITNSVAHENKRFFSFCLLWSPCVYLSTLIKTNKQESVSYLSI